MPLSLRPLRCPHCHTTIGKAELSDKALRRTLLARKPINCPKCDKPSQLPAIAEKLISTGLLLAVFAAPLSVYWQWHWLTTAVIGAAGFMLIVVGAHRQQLLAAISDKATDKTSHTSRDTTGQTDGK